ncbi:unnamed protein product [Mytilus coruscus]|uniref:Reverse transcriptase domain-containing protein n=1 Tax=Mytilus coruscus TaxID=42192 RepID=A0A6J8DVS9_MYTCO|nr:unnamed protein product [Mytilus coruscus]
MKLKLKTYEDKICKGAILRSKAQWAIDGDKSSKYFLQLEKYKQNSNAVKELKTTEGKILTTSHEILEEVYKFHEELYSSIVINKDKAKENFEYISEKVSDEKSENSETDLTLDEIKSSLFGMSKNNSQGPDGLTVEFFCKFFHLFGRDIADTTSSIRDLIEIIENDDLETYLIKVDQEKAFDKVDHDYLFLVLEKFGFGPKFMQWIKIVYNNVNSSVKCNGFLTKYVKLNDSIKQGCPVSALLYVLVAEPLSQAIIKNKNIQSVNIPKSNVNAKIFQHADDTNHFTSNKKSVNEAVKVLNLYSEASGAKINRQKSEIMSLVDVGDNRTIKAADVIANVEKEIGEGTVLACVRKSGNSYELTLTDKDASDLMVDTGFKGE